jgi:nitrogen fixation protein NifB
MSCESVESKIQNHPCYSEGAHRHYARIHLPVAPACNIQCHYCNRKYDCSNESRPGVTSNQLSPEGALKKVLHVGGQVKQLSVVGIAGPGDALANPKNTFETLRLVRTYAPDLKLCISTNGLRLPEFVDTLIDHGVDHITVTLNAIDPAIGAQIYPWVYDTHTKKRLRGEAGAALLLERQLTGIKMAIKRGMLVKVNSVLIPGVNETHLPAVAARLKQMGVFLHNIMGLLSQPEFGTHYGLTGVPSATAAQVKSAQIACGVDVRQMAHCQQCRADAVGILGEDRSAEFSESSYAKTPIDTLAKSYQESNRAGFQAAIEQFRHHLQAAQTQRDALSSSGETILIAVTAREESTIDWHFGSCDRFDIYEAGDRGVRLFSKRQVASYCSGESSCGTGPIEAIKGALKGVKYLLTARIGTAPREALLKAKITPLEGYADWPVKPALMHCARAHIEGKAFQNTPKEAAQSGQPFTDRALSALALEA